MQEKCNKENEAEALYQEMLENNGSNALAMKRLVALSKSIPNNNQSTCAKLNQYLKLFPGDIEAVSSSRSRFLCLVSLLESCCLQWSELADLHMCAKRWEYAAFCYEELILLEPQNPMFHTLAAESMLKANRVSPRVNKQKDSWIESLLEARRHAAHAVRMSKSFYGRALWVLAVSCVANARASQTSLNGDDIVAEGELDLVNIPASSLLNEPETDTNSKSTDEIVSFQKTEMKKPDQSLMDKDRNLALFILARNGLEGLYESTCSDLQRHGFKHLADLTVPESDIIIIPEVFGNWSTLCGTLESWGDTIAEAAKDGKTSSPPFAADK
jgi:tetratricopeptide (TPR) repeat protein